MVDMRNLAEGMNGNSQGEAEKQHIPGLDKITDGRPGLVSALDAEITLNNRLSESTIKGRKKYSTQPDKVRPSILK
jgi:hypothetical protein